MTAQITTGGVTYPISRSVTDTHPAAVHEALGTASEAELQACLDACHVDDWYGPDGSHLGPDPCGLEMFR